MSALRSASSNSASARTVPSWVKRLIAGGLVSGLVAVLVVVLAYQTVTRNARGRVYDDVEAVPQHQVALVLGTAPRIADGRPNLYFEHRIEAAAQLFHAGKVRRILVSGDHGTRGYNEPQAFLERLVQAGVPKDKIHLDFAGFRTLDSVVRANKVFGQEAVLVVSQRFHNERALYLADHLGLSAQGFNARGVGGRAGLKNLVRESLARLKLFFDLAVGVGPRFLGQAETIPSSGSVAP